jgi:hypothetical protein
MIIAGPQSGSSGAPDATHPGRSDVAEGTLGVDRRKCERYSDAILESVFRIASTCAELP